MSQEFNQFMNRAGLARARGLEDGNQFSLSLDAKPFTRIADAVEDVREVPRQFCSGYSGLHLIL